MVVLKGREQDINDDTNFFNSPIFSTFVVLTFYVAKCRTIFKIRIIVDILSPSFLLHHCLQILYTTIFLLENVFYILFHSFFYY